MDTTYMCTYTCTCICVYTRVFAGVYLTCTHKHENFYVYTLHYITCTLVSTCGPHGQEQTGCELHTCVCVCIYMYMYLYVYAYIVYVCKLTFPHIHIRKCMRTCICVSMEVFTHMHIAGTCLQFPSYSHAYVHVYTYK